MKYIPYIVILALIGVLYFSIKGCIENKGIADSNQALADYRQGKIDSFKNVKGQVIVVQTPAVTNNKHLIDSLAQALFNEKKLNLAKEKQVQFLTTVSGKFRVDTFIKYLPDTSRIAKTDSIAVPQKVSINVKDYQLTMTVQKKGVSIDSLVVPDSISIKVVTLKGGILKPAPVEIQTINSNAHVSVTGQNSIMYQPKSHAGWIAGAFTVIGIIIGLLL